MATVITTAESLNSMPAEPLVEYTGLMIGDQPLIAELMHNAKLVGEIAMMKFGWRYYMSPLTRIGHQRL